MVRTKADRVPNKAVGSKAPQKNLKSTPAAKSGGSSKGKNYSGGNPYHPRDTPEWQKPITCFLNQNAAQDTAIAQTSVSLNEEQSDNEQDTSTAQTSVSLENEEQNDNEEAGNLQEGSTLDSNSSNKSD